LKLLITISALGMFSRCIQGVQRLYFLDTEHVFPQKSFAISDKLSIFAAQFKLIEYAD
jgi:hypothetical protein